MSAIRKEGKDPVSLAVNTVHHYLMVIESNT